MTTRKRLLVVLMLLSLVAAACGSSDDDAVEPDQEEVTDNGARDEGSDSDGSDGDVAGDEGSGDDGSDGDVAGDGGSDGAGSGDGGSDGDGSGDAAGDDGSDGDVAGDGGSDGDGSGDAAGDDGSDGDVAGDGGSDGDGSGDAAGDDGSDGDVAGDEGSDGDGSGDDGPGSDLFGEPNPATGDPVKIGFVSDGQSDAIDFSAEIPAAQAAVDYANEFLGGVAGRTIELITCETKQTPAGAQDCVAELASEGVVAVLNGASGQGGTLSAELNEIGIPFLTASVNDQASMGAPLTFILINSLAVFVTPAAVAADAGLTNVAVVTIDVPAATGALNALVPLFYPNAGVEGEVVAVPPGTPDMTPQIQTAISKGAEMFAIIGDETFCISALQALEILGFDGPIVAIPTCVGEESVNIVDFEGVLISGPTSDDPADAERALFLAVMDEFAPDVSNLTVAVSGFMPVIAFARAMNGHPGGEMTPDTVTEALLAMEPAQVPVAPEGATFQCNRAAVLIAPAFCAAGTLITALDADGNSTGYAPVDLTEILTLG